MSATIINYKSPMGCENKNKELVSVIYKKMVYDIDAKKAKEIPFKNHLTGIQSPHDKWIVDEKDVEPFLLNGPRKGFWLNQGGWFSLEEDERLLLDRLPE